MKATNWIKVEAPSNEPETEQTNEQTNKPEQNSAYTR